MTEQYSHRNTAVVVGLKVDPSESNTSRGNIVQEVAKVLASGSGVNVKASDLSAVHRNGSLNSNSKAEKPPSITVVFNNSNVKDDVMSKYTNYDKNAKKSRDV